MEERQTVVGPSVSELTIRLTGGLPIRYIYQSFTNDQGNEYGIYEDLDVLFNIIRRLEHAGIDSPATLEAYILDQDKIPYFETRFFHRRIAYKYMPKALRVKFDLQEAALNVIPPASQSEYTNATIKPNTRKCLLEVITDFENGADMAALNKLFCNRPNIPGPTQAALNSLTPDFQHYTKLKMPALSGGQTELQEFKTLLIGFKAQLQGQH